MDLKHLENLFKKTFSERCLKIEKLPLSGSNREYYRLHGQSHTSIAAYNPVIKENETFIYYTKVFRSLNLNVPDILCIAPDRDLYLIEDLGDTTVFDFLLTLREKRNSDKEIIKLLKKVIDKLILFQFNTYKHIDFSMAFPRPCFDKQSIMWDLNYFKYYFLKLMHINFDEQLLEDDFNAFADYLISAESKYFMYRDFQSRNIMMKAADELYFIDYQGGRKGPLQYDLASLLYSAKTDLPEQIRDQLLEYYTEKIKGLVSDKENEQFSSYYYAFVLVRIMQALGAYGYRGLYERKEYFIQSIPLALDNLKTVLGKADSSCLKPKLRYLLETICESQNIKEMTKVKNSLTISLQSFSYKRGIPYDNSGNGGGFVFDCRGLSNPGRIEAYKHKTGNDTEVIEYLENLPETKVFLEGIINIIKVNIDNYIERGFSNLSIEFGCTGGQHRSVYCCNQTALLIKGKYPQVNVNVKHLELD